MFCFVILHYKTAKDTIDCIESIIKKSGDCNIIVVDNYSNNGSVEVVQSKFKDYNYIDYIHNPVNYGFAQGNNIGYKFAKEKLNADFIAVLNNDIIVETPNFVNRVLEIYNREKFHIMGPDIQSLVDGIHQNPMHECNMDKKRVNKDILRYSILYALSRAHLYDFVRKRIRVQIPSEKLNNEDIDTTNIHFQLHGAFIVFSKDYIENEDYAFNPNTFLYLEESILHLMCLKKKYHCVYCPEIKVFHKEDSSTNSLFTNDKDKREFVLKNMIKSLRIFRKALIEYENH